MSWATALLLPPPLILESVGGESKNGLFVMERGGDADDDELDGDGEELRQAMALELARLLISSLLHLPLLMFTILSEGIDPNDTTIISTYDSLRCNTEELKERDATLQLTPFTRSFSHEKDKDQQYKMTMGLHFICVYLVRCPTLSSRQQMHMPNYLKNLLGSGPAAPCCETQEVMAPQFSSNQKRTRNQIPLV